MIRRSHYSRFSQWFSRASGHPLSFSLAVGLIIAWIVIGPVFHFSDTWQLVMNTISSIVTFLMVFVIQNTQNRQTDALQIKLQLVSSAIQVPPQFFLMLPYVLTVVVLAGVMGRAVAPAAVGKPYEKE